MYYVREIIIFQICSQSRSVGYKTEFAFDHGPDVGTSDGRAVCSTLSQVMGSSPILAWNFFYSWASLLNCISYSSSRDVFSSIIEITNSFKQVSSH